MTRPRLDRLGLQTPPAALALAASEVLESSDFVADGGLATETTAADEEEELARAAAMAEHAVEVAEAEAGMASV